MRGFAIILSSTHALESAKQMTLFPMLILPGVDESFRYCVTFGYLSTSRGFSSMINVAAAVTPTNPCHSFVHHVRFPQNNFSLKVHARRS